MTQQKKLIVVEDSLTQARVIAAHVSRGIDVIIATDGLQALRLIRVERPNLIILDINLPKLNGIQVCRRLKREVATAHIPIIMLTADTSFTLREEGILAGADKYILKGEHAVSELVQSMREYQLSL